MATYPPYSEEALQYYLWGLRKGFLAPDVEVPDVEVPKEHVDFYNEGLVQGENYAAYGFPVETSCYDLREGHSWPTVVAEGTDLGLEGYGVLRTLYETVKEASKAAGKEAGAGIVGDKKAAKAAAAAGDEIVMAGLLGAAAEAGVLVLMASIAVTTHYELPTVVYNSSQMRALIAFLQQVSQPLSLELFVGGGVDYDQPGCQLQVTNIFKNAEYARQAVAAMGRPASMLLSMRTDMSGGVRVVEQSGQFYE